MPTPATPTPARIMGAATQYWTSALLLGAIKLDIFSLIPREGASMEDLARKGGLSPRRLELLLNALAAHEFLEKRDGRWFNAADTEAFLRRGGPAYLGGALGFALDLYEPWGRLDESLREDRPVAGERHLRPGAEETVRFVRAMHERALAIGPALVAGFDLAGCARLLDLGGGPGTLSLLLARRHPGLEAVVLDLPPVADVARGLLDGREEGLRVSVVGGSYLEDLGPQLGGARFDAVLLSGQMHQESLEDCGRILRNARQILASGGKLYLVDIMAEEGGHSPRFATLFGLNMALMRPNGGVHTRREMEDCLVASGFAVIRSGAIPLDYPYFAFQAEKA